MHHENGLIFSPQNLVSMLQQAGAEKVLVPNEEGDYPLHSIVRQHRQDKVELLIALLTHSSVDVNSHGKGGMTALHYAVQVCALWKTLGDLQFVWSNPVPHLSCKYKHSSKIVFYPPFMGV